MINFAEKVIEYINSVLNAVQEFIAWFNDTGLPEHTGYVMGKAYNFFIDVVCPLIADYCVHIIEYIKR